MQLSKFARRVLAGGVSGASLHGVRVGLGLVNSILLAQALGAAGLGVYAVALALVSVLGLPVATGLPQLVMRECAAAEARTDFGLVLGLLRFSNLVAVGSGLLIVALASMLLPVFDDTAWAGYTEAALVALILIPVRALNALRGAVLVGFKHYLSGQLPERAIQPLVMTLLLVTVSLQAPEWLTPSRALVLVIVSTLAGYLVGSISLHRLLPAQVRAAQPVYAVADWLRGVVPLTLNSVVTTLNDVGVTLLLGGLATPESAGYYRVARSLAGFAQYGRQALRYVIAPEFSRLWTLQQLDRLQSLLVWSARASLAIALLALALFAGFGQLLIQQLYGADFAASYVLLLVLTGGFVAEAACGYQGMLLTMTSHAATVTRILAVFVAGSLIGTAVLIMLWGALGAAIGAATYLFALHFWLLRVGSRLTGVRSSVFG